MATSIEWTDETWNPVTGCTKISPGCKNCYAERMARRLAGRCDYPEYPNHFKVTLHPDRLEQPLHWRKPRMVFVNSMSDLFHEEVPFDFAEQVWLHMQWAKQHTFQVLTKRPKRMAEFMEWYSNRHCINPEDLDLPYSNIWLGVSVENQKTADARIPLLLQIPAAVRFLSCEPLLGPIDLDGYVGDLIQLSDYDGHIGDGIDWLIVGGESGPHARPMHPDWARSLRDQCQAAEVSFFFKQWGMFIHASQMIPGVHCSEDELHLDSDYFLKCTRKHVAGRLLDGREWNQMPEVA